VTGRESRGERRYRLFLQAWPPASREELETELMTAFRWYRDRELERSGRLGPRFWAAMARDALRSGFEERREPLDARGRPSVRSHGGGDGMRGWIDDFGYAARRLVRSPGFALTALTILVLGIGVNATAFSVVNALLLQPPPFGDPEGLVVMLQDDDGGAPTSTSYPAYRDMTEYDVFESVSSFYTAQGFLGEIGEPLTPLLLEYATASYMEVIELTPSRGVWFDTSHDDPNGDPVAVLTYRMWSERMGEDPDVLGTTLRVNGGLVTVIGVGPPEFNGGRGPASVDLWLSVSAMGVTGGRQASLERRQDHPMTVRARLAEGVTVEEARAAMDGLAEDLARTYPEINEDRGISTIPLLDTRVSPEIDAQLVPAAAFAMAVVVLVLMIGTLNLANLLLVRSTARAREIAVRLALGAGRGRVVRVVLSEALLLSALGGAGGFAMAWVVAQTLRNSRFDFVIPILVDLRLDTTVVGFTALMAIGTGLIFGLFPALRATRRDVNATLRDDASAGLGARRRFGLTGLLVTGQVAVSVLLLALAGVFVDSYARAQSADPGIDYERTAHIQINTTMTGLEGEAALGLLQQLEERMRALPMIDHTTSALMLPAAQFGTTTLLLGAEVDGADRPTEIPWNYVTSDYFEVMGVELVEGRLFEASDVDVDVAVVSEAFARTYYGRTDVAGRTYRSEGSPDQPREIIGVVSDAAVRALGESPVPSIYWPLDFAFSRTNLLFAYQGDASEAIGAVQDAVRSTDGRIMILGAASMEEHLGDTLTQQRMVSVLLAALGSLALLLAMLGVYGVVSFAVSRRRQEVGIRIALGAARDSVVALFVRDVAAVVIIGALLGGALALPVSRLSAELFTGTGGNLAMSGVAAVVLLLTSLGATIVPAMRATRTDPTNALRQE
jgi:predicted permease